MITEGTLKKERKYTSVKDETRRNRLKQIRIRRPYIERSRLFRPNILFLIRGCQNESCTNQKYKILNPNSNLKFKSIESKRCQILVVSLPFLCRSKCFFFYAWIERKKTQETTDPLLSVMQLPPPPT